MFRQTLLGILVVILAGSSVLADSMTACRKSTSPDEQARACSDVIDSNPPRDKLAAAWTHRAEAYARKGMSREAADNFTRAIQVRPSVKNAWVGRGMARLHQRLFDAAISDYSMAIRIDSKDVSIYVARGYAHLAKNDPTKAIEDFTKGLEIKAGYISALNNRGLAYRKLGQVKLAISDYTKAIQINPLYALAYNNRGYAHEVLGKKAEAIDDFRNALAIDPSLVGARDALVRLSAASTIAAQSTKRVVAGGAIAQKSCAWCHATGKHGDSPNKDAPRFRDIHARHPIMTLRQPISRAIATPHDKMPTLPLSNDQVDQIIAYINSLRPAR